MPRGAASSCASSRCSSRALVALLRPHRADRPLRQWPFPRHRPLPAFPTRASAPRMSASGAAQSSMPPCSAIRTGNCSIPERLSQATGAELRAAHDPGRRRARAARDAALVHPAPSRASARSCSRPTSAGASRIRSRGTWFPFWLYGDSNLAVSGQFAQLALRLGAAYRRIKFALGLVSAVRSARLRRLRARPAARLPVRVSRRRRPPTTRAGRRAIRRRPRRSRRSTQLAVELRARLPPGTPVVIVFPPQYYSTLPRDAGSGRRGEGMQGAPRAARRRRAAQRLSRFSRRLADDARRQQLRRSRALSRHRSRAGSRPTDRAACSAGTLDRARRAELRRRRRYMRRTVSGSPAFSSSDTAGGRGAQGIGRISSTSSVDQIVERAAGMDVAGCGSCARTRRAGRPRSR